MAIVQSDVLEYLKRQGTYKNIEKRISYIAKLYNEEFHLIARSEIDNLNDLAGKKVNFDVKGSGTAITATTLFDTLKVTVEPTYFDQTTALDKLKSGEIAALVYVCLLYTSSRSSARICSTARIWSMERCFLILRRRKCNEAFTPGSIGGFKPGGKR